MPSNRTRSLTLIERSEHRLQHGMACFGGQHVDGFAGADLHWLRVTPVEGLHSCPIERRSAVFIQRRSQPAAIEQGLLTGLSTLSHHPMYTEWDVVDIR